METSEEKKSFIIKVEDLSVAYDIKPVLWDIDLEFPRGKISAIIGPNGAGKSTLLKSILGFLKPISGKVEFFINKPSLLKQVRKNIAYVPQSGSVDWDFPATVEDVVLMGTYGDLGWFKRPSSREREEALKTLERVGLLPLSSRQISQLSGGQQQRVFLARALVQKADIYFMDEPLKGVDVHSEKVIISLLKDLKAQGKTVIIVHHDLSTVKEYFDWVALINLRVIASGEVEDIFTEENLKKTYKISVPLLKDI